MVAVGDPRQAIYGFRGAADGAFNQVREALGATVLPLSVKYRWHGQSSARRLGTYGISRRRLTPSRVGSAMSSGCR